MNRVRVAVVAMFTVLSVVAFPSLASATEPHDIGDITGIFENVLRSPSSAVDQVIADFNNNGTPDSYDTEAMPWIASLITEVGGTPTQVQTGEKLASRACRTGWGCLGVLAAGIGLLGYGTSDTWLPWVQGLTGSDSQWEVQYAPSGANTPRGLNTTVDESYGIDTDHLRITFTGGPWSEGGGYVCSWAGCTLPYRIATDYVHKTTGEWSHYDGGVGHTGCSMDAACTLTLDPTSTGADLANYELRRIHFVGSPAEEPTGGFDRSFYWGQDLPPADGDIESLTRCKRPNGTTYDVVTVEPIGSGLTGVPACAAGDTPVYTQTTTIAPDGTRTLQSSQMLDDGTVGNALFPQCESVGCIWSVKVNGVTCTDGNALCVEWATDKNSATCWYGPYQMPLSQCYWLERAYENGVTVPATKPNTDGDPATWDGPTPQLQPTSTTTSTSTVTTTTQPTTTTSPTSTASPTTSTTTSTQPSSSPSATTSTGTGTGTDPFAGSESESAPSDPDGARCFPQGWAAFNPFAWVYKPVMCALRDAFQPDEQLTTQRVQSIRAKLESKGPGPALAQVGDLVDSIPSEGGCAGPGMTFPIGGHSYTVHLFSACDPPMSTAAGYTKALATVVLVVGGSFGVLRAISSAFGLNFSIGRGRADGD